MTDQHAPTLRKNSLWCNDPMTQISGSVTVSQYSASPCPHKLWVVTKCYSDDIYSTVASTDGEAGRKLKWLVFFWDTVYFVFHSVVETTTVALIRSRGRTINDVKLVKCSAFRSPITSMLRLLLLRGRGGRATVLYSLSLPRCVVSNNVSGITVYVQELWLSRGLTELRPASHETRTTASYSYDPVPKTSNLHLDRKWPQLTDNGYGVCAVLATTRTRKSVYLDHVALQGFSK